MTDLCFQVKILNIAAERPQPYFTQFACEFYYSLASAEGGGLQCSLCCVRRDGQGAVIRVAILSFQTARSCPFTLDLWLQGWYFGLETCLPAGSLSHLTVVCELWRRFDGEISLRLSID